MELIYYTGYSILMITKDWKFEKRDLIGRLSRVEGQVRAAKERFGVAHDPASMMQQLSAARNAIDQVGRLAILEYIKSEIADTEDPVARLETYSSLVKKYGW